jgi:hypothetical protein
MHLTICVIFLGFWGIGMITSNNMGGSIHIFLLGALGVMLLSLIQRRHSFKRIPVANKEK